eukprot:1157328-Pelagomonas_calceolata.AAC.6
MRKSMFSNEGHLTPSGKYCLAAERGYQDLVGNKAPGISINSLSPQQLKLLANKEEEEFLSSSCTDCVKEDPRGWRT